MERIKRLFKLGSKQGGKRILENFDISVDRMMKEKIVIEPIAKKEADITVFMRDLENLDRYNREEMQDGINNYLKLINDLRSMDLHEYADEIKGIYEVLANRILPDSTTVDEIADDYFKILDKIEDNIKSVYKILIENYSRTAAPKKDDDRRVFYDILLKGYKIIGDILVKKEFDFNETVGNLVLVSDLNTYCAEAWKDTLEELLVRYKENIYLELGDRIKITEEKDKIKRRLNEYFFIAREKVLKDISYKIIDMHKISESLRPHVLDIYKKYINKKYGFNLSETKLTDSYMYDKLQDQLIEVLEDYLNNVDIDEMVCNEVVNQYRDALTGANRQQAQTEIAYWAAAFLNEKKLKEEIDSDVFLFDYIFDDMMINVRKKAIEEIMRDKGYISKKTPKISILGPKEVEKRVLKILNYVERDVDEIKVKKELEDFIRYNDADEERQIAIFEGIMKFDRWKEYDNLIDNIIDNVGNGGRLYLMVAAIRNNLEQVKYLEQKGFPLNYLDKQKNTYLMCACEAENKDIVEYLLNKNIDINVQNIYGLTALSIAVKGGKRDIARILLEQGADVNVRLIKTLNTPAMMACINNDIETLKMLVDEYNCDINLKNSIGDTVMHIATKGGDLDIAKYLISKGIDINIQNDEENTPLHIACIEGNSEMAEYLLKHGADQNIKNENKDIPITIACSRGDLELTKVLLENGADIDAVNGFGENLMELAINNNGRRIVEYLLEKGIDPNKKCGDLSAIELAIKKGNMDLAKILLYAGANIGSDIKKKKERNNLEQLIKEKATFGLALSGIINGNKEVFKYIQDNNIEIKANAKEVEEALKYACIKGSLEAIRFILDNSRGLDISNEIWEKSLIYAAKNNNLDIVAYIVKNRLDINEKDKEQGNTLLAKMCNTKSVPLNLVNWLIENGAGVNEINNEGLTPLIYATYNADVDLTKCLLKHGAKVNFVNQNGDTPLMYACYTGNIEVVKCLIDNGAKLNIINKNEETALNYACDVGKENILEYLLKSGANPYFENEDGMSILATAISEEKMSVVKCLVENGVDINKRLSSKISALEIACETVNTEMVAYLLDHGAEVDEPSKDIISPIMLACKNGNLDIVKLLISHGANINEKKEPDRATPLIIASASGYEEIVAELIKNNADLDEIADETQCSAIFYSALHGYTTISKLLIDNNANLNIQNEIGNTVLIETYTVDNNVNSLKGENSIVKMLIDHGADLNIRNIDGDTVMFFAGSKGDEKLINYLVDHGAEVNVVNNKGYSPALLAAGNGKLSALKTLVEYGANLNLRTKNKGYTPLILASNSKNTDVVEYLLNNNSDINEQSYEGNSALMIATMSEDVEMVDFLLKNRANVNLRSNLGNTALMLAVKTGNEDIVESLIYANTYLGYRNKYGETVLDFARRSKNEEVIKIIEKGMRVQEYITEVVEHGKFDIADKLIEEEGITEYDIDKIYECRGMALYGDCVNCLYKGNKQMEKTLYDITKIENYIYEGDFSGLESILSDNGNSEPYNKVALILTSSIKREKEDLATKKIERSFMRRLINKLKEQNLKELKEICFSLENPVLFKEAIRENIITKEDLNNKEIQDIIITIKDEELIKEISDFRKSVMPVIKNVPKQKTLEL